MRSNKGFTLIELIVVIVVLGILAVTAAPKFIDVQDDAHRAVAQGVAASLNSVATMTHGKALIASQTGATGTIDVNDNDVAMVNGYPAAKNRAAGNGAGAANGVTTLIELPSDAWTPDTDTAGTLLIEHTEGTCVIYKEAENSNSRPSISVANTCP